MQTQKTTSRIYKYIKSAAAAVALPIFLVYVMVAKPDYKIIDGLGHVVLPISGVIGDIITWPMRAVGRGVGNIRELANMRDENAELRAKLDAALANNIKCDIAIAENVRLSGQLNIVTTAPKSAISANIVFDASAFNHETFFLDKGADSKITANNAVINFRGEIIGIVTDTGGDFARVRALTDSKSNIPVRVAGTEVYGFLAGRGASHPQLTFLSDPEFAATPGLSIVTSGIRGVLPDGIPVGVTANGANVNIANAVQNTTVMVLGFDGGERYK